MRYQQTLDWLFAQLPMYQRVGGAAYKADLKDTLALMELLGHPERKFKSVHVAGTNGKGSVSHMLAAIFQKAGYKTGLYTSPHLRDFRERIKINGLPIPESNVVDFVAHYKEDLRILGLSFFEMTVGMAFRYFADEKVDMAIIETGMGGRLDSTNVILPELSIITNISLDHTQFLGNSKEKIAGEKAGIIKPSVPVVIGEKDPETDPVFQQVAREKEAPLYFAPDRITSKYLAPETDLKGVYQEKNIRTVLAAAEQLEALGYTISEIKEEALCHVTSLTGLRGRWEQIGSSPKIICDTGHNAAGVQMVTEQLKRESYRRLHIVWGMVGDKDSSAILSLLPADAMYYFCKPDIPRGKDAEELKRESARYGLSGKVYPSVALALETARNEALPDDLIFVGGSTFVVAEALE